MNTQAFTLWRDYQKAHWELRNRSYEQFDKAVLTLASTGLGFSLAFLRDFAQPKEAIFLGGLITSWGLFTLAVITTVVSFFISPFEVDQQLSNAEKYYVDGNRKYFNKKNRLTGAIKWLNVTSGVSLLVAVVITVLFVSLNIAAKARG